MKTKIKRQPGDPAPTMEAVAQLAGVSKITVSRALRDSELVRPELREHIRSIARAAGYRINLAARNLRNRRSQTIAVVLEDIVSSERPVADPLLLLLIGGMLEELTAAGYALLLTTSQQVLKAEAALSADGIIMIGEGEGGLRARQVADLGLPMVVWGEPLAGTSVSVVGSDNREGGRLAAAHLLEQGCRRIVFLGDVRHPEVAARHEGVRDVLSASDAHLVASLSCEFSRKGGVDALGAALASGQTFDGVIASSDYIASGACVALAERGLSVPGDVAVIGYDDNPFALLHHPPLSSIRQEWDGVGRLLSRTVVALVEAPSAEPTHQVMPVQLVVRDTSRRHEPGRPAARAHPRSRAVKNSATRA